MRTSKINFDDTPFIVEYDFLDYNIVRFDKHYFALRRSDGPVDLVVLKSNNKLSQLLSSSGLETLKADISLKRLSQTPSV